MMVASLNMPREIEVLAHGSGAPAFIRRNRKLNQVAAILNSWRIDDEWWREMISRQYFRVELKNGLVITIFNDLVSGEWYQQRY